MTLMFVLTFVSEIYIIPESWKTTWKLSPPRTNMMILIEESKTSQLLKFKWIVTSKESYLSNQAKITILILELR